jgi:hypothetical protein
VILGLGDLFHRGLMCDWRPGRGCLETGRDRLAVSDFLTDVRGGTSGIAYGGAGGDSPYFFWGLPVNVI